jgi:hypothetical protein
VIYRIGLGNGGQWKAEQRRDQGSKKHITRVLGGEQHEQGPKVSWIVAVG